MRQVAKTGFRVYGKGLVFIYGLGFWGVFRVLEF
jgi:hypothetical protein